jgi:MFS family permease
MNKNRLFLASCIALIATAMSFAIRGDIMGDFEQVFVLNKTNVGWIAGAAFWGFGLSIFIGGPLCDLLGMGNIMRLAAAGHIGGALITILAPNFTVLFLATLLIGIANGLVEAAINPLIATIYAEEKTKKLVALHAWFPGGIVIGGVLCFLLKYVGFGPGTPHGWKLKMAMMLVPAVIYVFLYLGQKFPATERAEAGVPFGDMFKEALRPLFIVLWLCMWLTAATELGPGQWVANIFNDVMRKFPWSEGAGILLLCWINGLMYLLRQFGGPVAHRISPVSLITCTSVLAALGLWLYTVATTPVMWFAAAAIFAVGIAFWWPTMLGITSERFPKGGALLLALIGGTGSISTAVAGPVMGKINDLYGPKAVLPIWSSLPVVIFVVFLLIHLSDRAKGGYKIEKIGQRKVIR